MKTIKTMKTIIVTGSSRGIGLELVKQFAAKEHRVFALSRNTKPTEALDLNNVKSFPLDLENNTSIEKAVQNIKKETKQIDVLIHNAGALVSEAFDQISTEKFKALYQVNVLGPAFLTQLILPLFVKGSHTLAISSMGGVQGSVKFPGLSAYSSSKSAIIGLMELLAEEYKEKGFHFNSLAIGAVQTEMLAQAFPGYEAPLNPDEMANYMVDFCLKGYRYFNGKTIQVSSTTP